ncbi:MAG: hypothetical protein CL912_20135 [Deltaproteobacteria bacterium]|nr:hypothetical protein [Deltaproteobacteria bacterium]
MGTAARETFGEEEGFAVRAVESDGLGFSGGLLRSLEESDCKRYQSVWLNIGVIIPQKIEK